MAQHEAQFLLYKKEATLEEDKDNIKGESIVFLEEPGSESIRTQNKTYQTVPSNGKNGQVLIFREGAEEGEGKGVWTDIGTLDMLSYGVEWDPKSSDPTLTRIGNMSYHKTLPIQSGMKGCIYQPKNKKVMYWLGETDWRISKSPVTVSLSDISEDPSTLSTADAATSQGQPQADVPEPVAAAGGSTIPPLVDSEKPILHLILKSTEDVEGAEEGQPATTKDYGNINYFIDRYATISTTDESIEGLKECIWQFQKSTTLEGKTLFDLVLIDDKGTNIKSHWATEGDNIHTKLGTVGFSNFKVTLHTIFNGYDGEVMVYVPEFYIRSWDENDVRRVRISPIKIDDSWQHQPAIYLAAYGDTVLNSVPENMGYLSTLEANAAVSVANTNSYCRGGDGNSTTYDGDTDIFKGNLGKRRTKVARASFREYARKANKEIMSYRQYKNILYWLWVIEYATFYSQDTFHAELTLEGFHQGGMGNGLTNVSNWNAYNGRNPISPNGYTNEFGNGTAVKLIASNTPAPKNQIYATRWRGIEDNFGGSCCVVDGVIIKSETGHNDVYTTDNPTLYSDSEWQKMEKVGEEFNNNTSSYVSGYIKEWDLGSTAEIIPRSHGGNATQYKCDGHRTGCSGTLRTLLFGGDSEFSAEAGLGSFCADRPTTGGGDVDIRLGFRTAIVV